MERANGEEAEDISTHKTPDPRPAGEAPPPTDTQSFWPLPSPTPSPTLTPPPDLLLLPLRFARQLEHISTPFPRPQLRLYLLAHHQRHPSFKLSLHH